MTELKIHQQIALLRKSHHMTQEDLAQSLGVTNQTVSKWESAQCCPDIQHLPTLARFFGVTVDTLLGCAASADTRSFPDTADGVMQTAAALHVTALCRLSESGIQPHPFPADTAAKRVNDGQWGYSCLCAPMLTTTMRGGSVFFSNNRTPALKKQSLRSIATLLKPFGAAINLRALSALYNLTVQNESYFAPLSALSEALGLSQQEVSSILEGDLSAYLEENDQGFRIAGMYMNLLPIFSLLDFK